QKLINDGYSTVEYINPKINIVNETSAILTAKWKMNKANGVIHKELWVLQEDGTAKLREDDFEIKE
ncbi:MAG: isochorismatase, partial [Betaproteobacteria bacterium]